MHGLADMPRTWVLGMQNPIERWPNGHGIRPRRLMASSPGHSEAQ